MSVSASIGPDGLPTALKLVHVDGRLLVPGWKEPTAQGKAGIIAENVHPHADAIWLNSGRMHRSPLRQCLEEARQWMNRLFNGVGSKYLQNYLNEFCYRWNAAARGNATRDDWLRLGFRPRHPFAS